MSQDDRAQIELLPYAALIPSPLNPRKQFDETKLAQLADSIFTQGILQNLVVRRVGSVYEIAAGERRWRAVGLLIEQERVAVTYELPAAVRELSDLELLQIATSENVKRADMHPLEEADAYLQMVKLGETPESIATAVGVATSSVQKRLRIAESLCATGRKKLLAGKMTLAQAQALTIAPKKDQEALLKMYSDTVSPQQIRRALTVRRPALDKAFFPLERYTAKKGTIIQDVFDPEASGYFADFDLFVECQREAVEEEKAELEKTGRTVHIVEASYLDWDKWDSRKNHSVILINPSTFDVDVRKDYGPKERKTTTTAANPSGTVEGTAPAQKNKRRLAFEDQALTRAVQHGVADSTKLAVVLTIASAMTKLDGSRYQDRGDNYRATRESAYHDDEVSRTLAELRADLCRVCEVNPEKEPEKEDMLNGPRAYGHYKGRATAVLEYLNSLDEQLLECYFRAVMAAHVMAFMEGEGAELHTWLLEQLRPDMHDFFTAGSDYLNVCTKAELEAVAPQVGASVRPTAKKADVVAQLSDNPNLATWLPERLRLNEGSK